MKKLAAMILLVFLAFNSNGQVTLKPGESWSYSFSSLPFYATQPGGPPPYVIPSGAGGGGFHHTIQFEPGGACSIEVFENSTNESPVATVVRISGSGTNYSASALWNDRNGSLRFTAQTNSVTVASFRLFNWQHDPVFFTIWGGAEATVIPPLLPPVLNLRPLTNAVTLSWSTNGTAGYALEATDNFEAPFWSAVPQVPQIIEGRNHISVTTTGAMRFFRLKK